MCDPVQVGGGGKGGIWKLFDWHMFSIEEFITTLYLPPELIYLLFWEIKGKVIFLMRLLYMANDSTA